MLAGSAAVVQGQAQSAPLSVGDWWSVKGTSHRASSGSGSCCYGGFTEDTRYTDKFTVTSIESNQFTVYYDWSESWTSTANGNWQADKDGSDSGTSQYIIDLTSLNVVNGTKGAAAWIGYPVWFLVNPAEMGAKGTLQRGAWVISDDAQSNALKSVAWNVGEPQTIQVNGQTVTAYSISYTGPRRGYLRYSETSYSQGSETVTELFDSVHGIWLGESRTGNYKLERSDGGFTETYSQTNQFDDTNLDFSVPAASTSTTVAEPTSIQTTETTPTATVTTSILTQTVATEPFSLGGTGLIAVIGLVATIAIVGAWLVMRSRSRPPSTPALKIESVVEKYCIECGKPLTANQNYCPKCGTKQQ